jgi:hypothetical protein
MHAKCVKRGPVPGENPVRVTEWLSHSDERHRGQKSYGKQLYIKCVKLPNSQCRRKLKII